jgi:hypothetical protein
MADGIRAEGINSKQVGGVTVHTGRVAEGQIGYRAMKAEELEPESSPHAEHGYRSRGTFNTKVERGSRGSTMFSATPLTHEEMEAHGYTHQIEADLSGLKFRTLRQPEGDAVHADLGLGLGVVGEMDWGRIKRMWKGKDEVVPDEADHIGQQFKHHIFEDTGRWPRGD